MKGKICVHGKNNGLFSFRSGCGKTYSTPGIAFDKKGNCIFCGNRVAASWLSPRELCALVGFKRLTYSEKDAYFEATVKWYEREMASEGSSERGHILLGVIKDVKREWWEFRHKAFKEEEKIEKEYKVLENQIDVIVGSGLLE